VPFARTQTGSSAFSGAVGVEIVPGLIAYERSSILPFSNVNAPSDAVASIYLIDIDPRLLR